MWIICAEPGDLSSFFTLLPKVAPTTEDVCLRAELVAANITKYIAVLLHPLAPLPPSLNQ